jgi:nickel-type superoxide dismutase maturation protease
MILQPVRVVGHSMWPTFKNGDTLLFDTDSSRLPILGDVVLAQHPNDADLQIIKRIFSIENDDYFLSGDNPDPTSSEDSHNFGKVPRASLLGILHNQ